VFGADGRLDDVEALYLNRAALDRWYGGQPLDALAGRRLVEIQPADGRYLRDIYRRVVETGEPYEDVGRFESPTGLMWARLRVVMTAEGLVHTSHEITDAVLAREEQAGSLHALEEAQRTGHVGSFEWDPATGEIRCSDEYLRLLGFDPRHGLPTSAERLARLDPEAGPALLEEIRHLAAQGAGEYERAMRVIIPGEADRFLLFRGRIVATDDGSPRVVGTAVDITALRRAEALATASEERFAAVVEAVEEAIAILRPILEDGALVDMEVEWANRAWRRREAMEGRDPAGVRGFELHPEFRAFVPTLEAMLAGGGAPHSEEVRLADGRWLAVSIVRLHDRILVASRDITERRAEQEADHARLLAALDHTGDAVSITDAEGRLVYVNRAFEALAGVERESALGQVPFIIQPAPGGGMSGVEAQLRRGVPWRGTVERTRPDGRQLIAETAISPVTDDRGNVNGFVAVTRDVSAARAEAATREQAARLEAVGRLAGGVAHDFNNVLAAITGYGRFVRDALGPSDPARVDVEQILIAADRAAALTRQLLAFSRRQAVEPQVLQPAAVLAGLLPMLRRLIGEHVAVEEALSPDAPPVFIDPGQFEQVVVNLVVNARDAMPDGGRLTVAVQRAERDGRALARIVVSDTGAGMDDAVRAHLFEPFYTTKGQGKGTGLGLATVYGIVQGGGGTIDVASEIGVGSTFTVDLPAHEEAAEPSADTTPVAPPRGSEHVLLVEDDPAVRGMTARALRALGYGVTEAASGGAALDVVRAGHAFDLLISDLRMPGIQGQDLARRLREERPSVRVLFVSGLVSELERDLFLDAEVLEKPFTPDGLARAVRRALG
jgi:PAS domain S-box-containing protein